MRAEGDCPPILSSGHARVTPPEQTHHGKFCLSRKKHSSVERDRERDGPIPAYQWRVPHLARAQSIPTVIVIMLWGERRGGQGRGGGQFPSAYNCIIDKRAQSYPHSARYLEIIILFVQTLLHCAALFRSTYTTYANESENQIINWFMNNENRVFTEDLEICLH